MNFCRRPFFTLQLNNKGDARTCCGAWISRKIGDWRRQTLDEIWTGKAAQEVRQSIVDGRFTWCNREWCEVLQNPNHALRNTDGFEANVVNPPLTRISLNIEGACNLACPFCRHSFMKGQPIPDDHPMMRLSREVVERFNTTNGVTIVLVGAGEPMMQRTSAYILNSIKRTDANGNNRIHLVTNGTLLARRWPKFVNAREFRRVCTIATDAGTKETYEINRRGGKWHDLMQGISFAVSEFDHVSLTYIVQANNYKEAPRLVRIAEDFGCDAVQFCKLINRGTFTDQEYRKRAVHFKDHPEHEEFLAVFRDLKSYSVRVDLRNLTGTVKGCSA